MTRTYLMRYQDKVIDVKPGLRSGGGVPGLLPPKMCYMMPFEAGISPKFTIFDNKFIYAYVGLCISKLGLHAGIRIIIVMASFWCIFGRF